MSNMELEVKVLNINKEKLISKIKELGGKYISSSQQYLRVYDLTYINQRYYSNVYELNNEKMETRKDIVLSKIKNLFQEIDQLLSDEEVKFLNQNFAVMSLSQIFTLEKKQILNILNSNQLKALIDNYKATPKKWIRLRKTVEEKENKEIKEKTTLTIKHVLKNDKSNIQQMQETQIEVSSFEETNELLEKLGFSYRSYQEKKREKYIIKEHEIDIDTWPGLSPFMEIEGKNREDIENILNMLGYSFKDTISCTVDEIYQKIGIDINNMKELKFESVK